MQATVAPETTTLLEVVARELFDSVNVEHESDPEIPTLNSIVVRVTTRGSVAEVADCRREWHRRTQSIVEEAGERVQLLIDTLE